ncbi:MAG: rhodanese-like domain-containing protein [Oscillospiraceae bacterium]|jgi:phage shock protein E|nr:rhodanese-like domain-containing protein [Oscillospiraceae bacterium]
MKTFRKILYFALALCLLAGLMPPFAAEAAEDPSPAVSSVSDGVYHDIDGHWAEDAVKTLAEQGALTPGGRFKPDAPVLLSDFLEMIIKGAGRALGGRTPVEFALENGMITQEDSGGGGDPLARTLAAKFAYFSASFLLGEEDEQDVSAITQLSDYDLCHTCRGYLEQCYAKGVVFGRPGGIYDGDALLTNAEAAAITARLIDPALRVPHRFTAQLPADGRVEGVILPEELLSIIAGGANPVLIVDVRTADEYQAGHIAGAVNIPIDDIIAQNAAQIPDDDTIVAVYCAVGARSQKAYDLIKTLGYENIYNLGKVGDWPEPLVTG